jgi:16S rRNA (cytosine967-C5)-methyltransferase
MQVDAYKTRREARRTPASWAARIVARSEDGRPADREMRTTLRNIDGLRPADARWISRAVFAYYRWKEWLDPARILEKRLDQAMGFADTYSRHPQAFPDEDLLAGAIPQWVHGVVEVPIGWVRALQREPRLWLRARPETAKRLALTLGGPTDAVEGVLPDSVEYRGTRDLFRTGAFHRGELEIQDVSSQVVGLCCAPKSGERWWDVCAGEGGKTLHLADLLRGKGEVLGTDRASWRLERLHERVARAKTNLVKAVVWDEQHPVPGPDPFDGVLVDAPCSGLGTWGRNPHARWTATEKDVAELAVCQLRLLDKAAPAVKPGGRLVYSVCTVTRAETFEVAKAFLAAHPEFEPAPFGDPFQPENPPAAERLFWPQDTGGNGMFVAAWRRKTG